eukprot:4872225-Amphidinium_carterae.1
MDRHRFEARNFPSAALPRRRRLESKPFYGLNQDGCGHSTREDTCSCDASAEDKTEMCNQSTTLAMMRVDLH